MAPRMVPPVAVDDLRGVIDYALVWEGEFDIDALCARVLELANLRQL